MKRFLVGLLVIAMIAGVISAIGGIKEFFSGGCDGNGIIKKEPKYTMITVKGGENMYTCEVEIGTKPHVDLPIKENYMCTGLYSAEEGGTKYFDEEGDATMEWQENFPTVLYGQFKSVIGLTYVSELEWEEDPHYISFWESYSSTYAFDDEFILALKSNSSLDVKIVMSYDIIGVSKSGNSMQTYISSTKGSEGLIKSDNYYADYSSFTTRTITATCKAKQLLKNNFVYFKIGSELGYENTRVKNLRCTVEILGTSQE